MFGSASGGIHIYLINKYLLNVDYTFQAMLKVIVEKEDEHRSHLPGVSMLADIIRNNHEVDKEVPELTASHRHTESTPTYRAIPPYEELKAD